MNVSQEGERAGKGAKDPAVTVARHTVVMDSHECDATHARGPGPRPGKLHRCYSHDRVGLGQHLTRASLSRIASRSFAHTPST